METAKISPQFHVVIPKKLRAALKLSPGQRVQMVVSGDRIEMIPLRKISEMKGFLKGIDTDVEREPDRTEGTAWRLHVAEIHEKRISRREDGKS